MTRYFIAVLVILCACMSSPALGGEPALSLTAGEGNAVKVELTNEVPVRGLQFSVSGAKISEVRTTPRTTGYLVKFNENNGKVLMVSPSGGTIAQGKGPVAEIICDKPKSASLSGVTIVKGVK